MSSDLTLHGDPVESIEGGGLAALLNLDPATAKALAAEAAALYERAVYRPCPFGNCDTAIDPLGNTIASSAGPVGCGCDSLPGWRSRHYDGLPKPGWPAKPVGRHGSRIAASRAKHADHQRWLDDLHRYLAED